MMSKAAVCLPVAQDSDAILMFRLLLTQGRSLVQHRNVIEARAAELLADHPDYRLLRAIPGLLRLTRVPSWPRSAICGAFDILVSS